MQMDLVKAVWESRWCRKIVAIMFLAVLHVGNSSLTARLALLEIPYIHASTVKSPTTPTEGYASSARLTVVNARNRVAPFAKVGIKTPLYLRYFLLNG